MDRLWAPWRIKYIKQPPSNSKGCLFCRLAKEKRDVKNLVLFRSRHSFCILNKYPYNNGHLLVSPYRHIKNLNQLKNSEALDMFYTSNKMQHLLKQLLSPDGFNIGINIGRVSGAGIPSHIHLHIVPRWKEDTNFMPVVFDTKVISQSLSQLYEELHRRIRK